ncbi:hypothetical protein TNCV_459331, partial [Trichonephila clavipes]
MISNEWRTNRWMPYHKHLPLQIPDRMPVKYVPLLIRGQYSSLEYGEGMVSWWSRDRTRKTS